MVVQNKFFILMNTKYSKNLLTKYLIDQPQEAVEHRLERLNFFQELALVG